MQSSVLFEKKDKKTFPGKAQTVRAKVFCMYARLSFFLAVQQEEEEEGREVCLSVKKQTKNKCQKCGQVLKNKNKNKNENG